MNMSASERPRGMSRPVWAAIWVMVGAMLAAAALTATGTIGQHGAPQASVRHAPQASIPPASCHVHATAGRQAATTVSSGDAGWYWVPRVHAYQTFVCTDGVLVHVTGYGN